MIRNIFLGLILTAAPGFAQWAVFDVMNLTQSVTNHAALVSQLAKQAEQITNQVQQIKHMEDQLARIGKMSDFTSLIGFPEYKLNLTLPTRIKTWADSLAAVDGSRLFGDTRGGIFRGVANRFLDFDGASVARSAVAYKPAHDIANKVDNFREVQADVYVRRESLKRAIAVTSEALRAAGTEAEEKKLEAVLSAQYGQLATLDSEVTLSAAEIQVKTAEAGAMQEAQGRADAETREKLAQQEAEKLRSTFKPIYTSILLYVREEPYVP